MNRYTKIVATIGPASSDIDTLTRMIRAGVDVVRLNFSHGKAQDHIDRANMVREVAASCGREVAIMADLQGPKIRIGKFEHGKIQLANGVLTAAEKLLIARGAVQADDLVVVTWGEPMGETGGTNAMKIMKIASE